MALTLSDEAAKELLNVLDRHRAEEPNLSVRIELRGGWGGPGFAMGLDVPSSYDTKLVVNGVPIIADPRTLPYLDGLRIGFTSDAMGEEFVLDSDDVEAGADGCGCGSGSSGCSCGHHH